MRGFGLWALARIDSLTITKKAVSSCSLLRKVCRQTRARGLHRQWVGAVRLPIVCARVYVVCARVPPAVSGAIWAAGFSSTCSSLDPTMAHASVALS